ncbi:MAG TPA: M28 family peptidase [Gemmatimonadales bacterium]|jgi:hypothetical protein
MIRRVAMAAVIAASACKGSATQAQQFDGNQAHRWVEFQVAAGPRIPNTAPHRVIGDWLVAQLRQRADTVIVQEWVHVTKTGDSLHLRNIFARFKPADPNRVLYVSHWDTKPHATQDPDVSKRNDPVPGAEDGASSTAMLLGVADELKKQPPALGVDLLFVDGEDYGNFEDDYPDNCIGARYFAAHMPTGYRPLFAVLWDMIGDYDQSFPQEANSVQNAPEVVQRVWGKASELGLDRVFRDRTVPGITDDHIPLQAAGLRIVDVIDCCNDNYAYWHTTQDTPDKVSPRSLANAGMVAVALVR